MDQEFKKALNYVRCEVESNDKYEQRGEIALKETYLHNLLDGIDAMQIELQECHVSTLFKVYFNPGDTMYEIVQWDDGVHGMQVKIVQMRLHHERFWWANKSFGINTFLTYESAYEVASQLPALMQI